MKINYKDYLIRTNPEHKDSLEKWLELEKRSGIKFFLKDGTFRPVNEWLDDLFLQFTKEQAYQILMEIMRNGDELFADLLTHRE